MKFENLVNKTLKNVPVVAILCVGASISGDSYAQQAARPYEVTEERALCDHYEPLKQVFWGDTHVHTAYSLDAGVQDTRNTPDDAYRYAKGGRVGLQPYTDDGEPLRTAKISAPLDFTVVTDHGEAIGMVGVCTTPKYEDYNSFLCKAYRNYPRLGFFLMVRFPVITRRLALRYDTLYVLKNLSDADSDAAFFCAEGDCLDASRSRWQDTQNAAERAYDRSSACTFSSFVGYEWTGNAEVNLHRNIIFRNERVLELPLSYVQLSTAEKLIDGLNKECLDRDDGCDVLSIPHNSNLSEGQMFVRPEDVPLTYTAEQARTRARTEPLLEIMQHKGDSECFYGAGGGVEDEFCSFEQLPYRSFGGKFLGRLQGPATAEIGFARDILYQGMRFQRLIGANPYRMGFIAASDTHLGTPGAVEEWQHQGHGGAGLAWSSKIEAALPDDIEYNPGGLMGVWAEENNRDSIFSAMRSREVYGTSGPRITVRMFALPDNTERGVSNLCNQNDRVATAYREGLPMGATVRDANSMHFYVDAVRDPGVSGREGNLLQRIQIIKGWLGRDGERRERVVDIAGGDNGATVDLDSCMPRGEGDSRMCAVWRDNSFDNGTESYYYARVLENPSCRWSTHICNAQGVDCSDPSSVPPGYAQCCSGEFPSVIQERAWTSPIFYLP